MRTVRPRRAGGDGTGRRTGRMRALGGRNDGGGDETKKDNAEVELTEDVGVVARNSADGRRSRDAQNRSLYLLATLQPEAGSSTLPSPATPQTTAVTTEVLPTPRPRRAPSTSSAPIGDVVPDSIGRETCPICIVDFEEGDDLRVLPCEGRHRFHLACVDQWLLELSGSCPICRQGMSLRQSSSPPTF